jgi:hypothetical protein
MLPNDYLHHVNLHPSFNVDVLTLASTESFDLKGLIFDSGDRLLDSSKFGIIRVEF